MSFALLVPSFFTSYGLDHNALGSKIVASQYRHWTHWIHDRD